MVDSIRDRLADYLITTAAAVEADASHIETLYHTLPPVESPIYKQKRAYIYFAYYTHLAAVEKTNISNDADTKPLLDMYEKISSEALRSIECNYAGIVMQRYEKALVAWKAGHRKLSEYWRKAALFAA